MGIERCLCFDFVQSYEVLVDFCEKSKLEVFLFLWSRLLGACNQALVSLLLSANRTCVTSSPRIFDSNHPHRVLLIFAGSDNFSVIAGSARSVPVQATGIFTNATVHDSVYSIDFILTTLFSQDILHSHRIVSIDIDLR